MAQAGQQVLRTPRTQALEAGHASPLDALAPACAAALAFFESADPQAAVPESSPGASDALAAVNAAHAIFDATYEDAELPCCAAGALGQLEVNAVHEWAGLLGDAPRRGARPQGDRAPGHAAAAAAAAEWQRPGPHTVGRRPMSRGIPGLRRTGAWHQLLF